MDKLELRKYMNRFGDDNASLASSLGIAPQTLSLKLNESHGRCFDKHEIEAIAKRYTLNDKEVITIFFDNRVSQKDT